jgi:hypothetical protein
MLPAIPSDTIVISANFSCGFRTTGTDGLSSGGDVDAPINPEINTTDNRLLDSCSQRSTTSLWSVTTGSIRTQPTRFKSWSAMNCAAELVALDQEVIRFDNRFQQVHYGGAIVHNKNGWRLLHVGCCFKDNRGGTLAYVSAAAHSCRAGTWVAMTNRKVNL